MIPICLNDQEIECITSWNFSAEIRKMAFDAGQIDGTKQGKELDPMIRIILAVIISIVGWIRESRMRRT